MTVKELIEVLEALDPDATVHIAYQYGGKTSLEDREIYNSRDGAEVTFDIWQSEVSNG